jgi:outer membrane protein TolC
MATQPVFMGGSIIAMNKLADLGEEMASNSADARLQTVIYNTDQAYWQVVSLRHKKNLAESYLQLVTKLDDDVQKMISEGVATRSDGLSVSVKVNEAEMAVQKVSDGLTLSRMLLCKIIGLPLDEDIILADESLSPSPSPTGEGRSSIDAIAPIAPIATIEPIAPMVSQAQENRPELRMLGNVIDMSRQTTNILKAGNLPQVALTGGYAVSNPNVFNGFQKKFSGFWNVGVLVRIPLWNWGDVAYKVRASKGATAIANLEMQEARDLIELQVNQTNFKVTEADKRLAMAQKSIERAEENLRTANLGFREGVITPTVVMEAQTAWLQAQSQVIDAQIELKLAQVDQQKALGVLSVK